MKVPRWLRPIFVLLLSGLLLVLLVLFVYPRDGDFLQYRHLIHSTTGGNVKEERREKAYVAQQRKNVVLKEISFENQNQQRLRLKVASKGSDLVFDQHEGRTEIFEKLYGVACSLQEELFSNLSEKQGPYVLLRGTSQEAKFDGTALQLFDTVHLESDLGEISCESAHLLQVVPENAHQKNTRIVLKGNVRIHLQGGGVLHCASAEIDGSQECASFFPDDNQEFVRYEEKRDDGVGYSLQSREMHLKLSKNTAVKTVEHGIHAQVGQMEAKRDVTFAYEDRLVARSDSMIWDGKNAILALDGNIEIHENSLGTLTTNNRVLFMCEEEEGRTQLRSIHVCGRVVVNRFDPKKSLCYMLLNDGTTFVDHKKMRILMDSAADQIHFQGIIGEVFSDHVTVNYSYEQHAITPSKIVLDGNVKLLNYVNADLAKGGEMVLQYALADQIEYFPAVHALNMSAQSPQRVLFFDRINHMQISAPGLKVVKDATTGKEVIQGLGDVRFRFLEQEIYHLKKRFFFQEGESHEL